MITSDTSSRQHASRFVERREFLQGVSALGVSLALSGSSAFADSSPTNQRPICAFIKFLQSLSYQEMASQVAASGFDGIESTVRKGGHVDPERVEDELPKQFEAVKDAGLDMTLITTDVLRVDQPHTQKVLRTASRLGIKKYRMGFYYYSRQKPIRQQLQEIKSALVELAALNRELGISAVYQNHSGANFVGAPIWDFCGLIDDISPDEVGIAFDIRHATIEGGLAWPLNYRVAKPHIRAYFMKDFDWKGLKDIHVPLGTGRVDHAFFKSLQNSDDNYPISLHVEYLEDADAHQNLTALQTDLATLRQLLNA